VTGVLAQSLNASSPPERAARRAVLEERLAQETRDFQTRETAARSRAEEMATAAGFASDSTAFIETVAAVMRGLLEPHVRALESIRADLSILQVEVSQDKRTAALLDAVAKIGSWDDLDVGTRNRLMRSIIESITVYPRAGLNCLEIKLVGIDISLPHVYLRRTPHLTVAFPTVSEWLLGAAVDTDGGPVIEPLMTNKTMEPFHRFLRKHKKDDDQAQRIAAILVANSSSARHMKRKETVVQTLERGGADEELLPAFEQIYRDYIEHERQRLFVKEAAERTALMQHSAHPDE
jgi:hypothetical protein